MSKLNIKSGAKTVLNLVEVVASLGVGLVLYRQHVDIRRLKLRQEEAIEILDHHIATTR